MKTKTKTWSILLTVKARMTSLTDLMKLKEWYLKCNLNQNSLIYLTSTLKTTSTNLTQLMKIKVWWRHRKGSLPPKYPFYPHKPHSTKRMKMKIKLQMTQRLPVRLSWVRASMNPPRRVTSSMLLHVLSVPKLRKYSVEWHSTNGAMTGLCVKRISNTLMSGKIGIKRKYPKLDERSAKASKRI